MKFVLWFLFIGAILGTCLGFYLKSSDPETGHFLIGISITVTFFVLMPLFIYHRWKDRKVKDYMLTQENIEKMRKFSEDKKL